MLSNCCKFGQPAHGPGTDVDNIHKAKIFITRPDLPPSALSLLKDYELDIWKEERVVPAKAFLQRVSGKDALFICSYDRVTAETLDAAGRQLKVIGTMSAGYDHIDVDEVKRRGVKLGSTACVMEDTVAELTIGLLLTKTRRISEGREMVIKGHWKQWMKLDWLNGVGLKESVVGFVGLGRIGMEVGRRIVPFKPSKILYHARTTKPLAEDEFRAKRMSLEELLRQSDVVIVSLPLTPETRGLLNEERLGLMKPNAILVNVGRGAVIDQDALVKILKNKAIAGAALDVVTPEPLPKNHKLLSLDNCYVIPHMGSCEKKTRIAMAELTARNIVAGLSGKPLPEEVSLRD